MARSANDARTTKHACALRVGASHIEYEAAVEEGFVTLAVWQQAGYGLNSISEDPLLLDDYVITSESPCDDAGRPVDIYGAEGHAKRDIDGYRRGFETDIGASVCGERTFEYAANLTGIICGGSVRSCEAEYGTP